jgi:hypothetical protein
MHPGIAGGEFKWALKSRLGAFGLEQDFTRQHLVTF